MIRFPWTKYTLEKQKGPATTVADSTLSGTPKIIAVKDATTGALYYIKAYPTKA
jgi:hypothetical protein